MSGHLDHGLDIDRAAWSRCFNGYLTNALLPDSIDNWSGNMTVRDLAIHAQAWADDFWTDHTRGGDDQ